MFDIVLATYIVPTACGAHGDDKPVEKIDAFGLILLCVLLVAALAAIVVACRRRDKTSSYSLDVLLAVFSPITYWILFAFQCVSH